MNICEFWTGKKRGTSSSLPDLSGDDDGKAELLEALRLLAEAQGDSDLARQRIAKLVSVVDQFVAFRAILLTEEPRDVQRTSRMIREVISWFSNPQQLWDLGFSLIYSFREAPGGSAQLARLCGLVFLDINSTLSGKLISAPVFLGLKKEFCSRYGLTEFDEDHSTYLRLIPAIHPDLARNWEFINRLVGCNKGSIQ